MSRKPLTNQQAINKLNQLGLKYDFSKFEYNGKRSNKSIIICPEHGEFKNSYHYIIKSHNGLICKKCRYENHQLEMLKQYHDSDFNFKQHLIDVINDLKCNNIDITKIPDNTHYNTKNSKIKLYCRKHGEFNITYQTLKKYETGCPDCKKEDNKKGRRTYDLKYIQNIAKQKGGKCISSKYQGINNRYEFICKNGSYFNTTLKMILNKNVWCNCKLCSPDRTSKAEDQIIEYLNSKNIKYISEKRFDDCLSNKNIKLRFDFYLPDYNMCIEYDGKQHYEPIKYFGGETIFQRTIINDKVKNKYCNDNKIKLIRIPYFEKNYIENILFFCLKL